MDVEMKSIDDVKPYNMSMRPPPLGRKVMSRPDKRG